MFRDYSNTIRWYQSNRKQLWWRNGCQVGTQIEDETLHWYLFEDLLDLECLKDAPTVDEIVEKFNYSMINFLAVADN